MVVVTGHSPAGQVAVRAVGHERLVVLVFGSIWARGSFLWTPVPKSLPQARMLPDKSSHLEYMSYQVRMGLTVPASLPGAPARAGAVRIQCAPVLHARSENRPARRLTIEATVRL